tara:strand:+ start:5905 stop:6576 length:672 start_codon:yes stop_codon:yes gene_type:complete
VGLYDLLRPAKKVPSTWWSSKDPMSVKPRLSTITILVTGLLIFGAGDAILIAAGVGNTPWTVLAEGMAVKIGWTVGQSTFLVSVLVLFLWIPLKEKPGVGTILNAILIAAVIHYMDGFLPNPEKFEWQILQVLVGSILVGIGSGLYLTANLGPGPRDGWMTGIQRVTGIPIGRVRGSIEISVLVIGWLLGGTFGIGTIIFALIIGPVVASCLNLAGKVGSVES